MMFSIVDVKEKENIPREIAALVTPKRCPLRKIQENQIYASPLGATKKRAASIGPQALHKVRRQPKRLSVPLHALSKVLESETVCVQSPVKTWKRQQSTELDYGSPLYKEAGRYCTPVNNALGSGNISVCKSVDRYVCEERKDVQKLIHGVASAILREMKKDEVDTDSAEQKVKEHEKTIIQMNKERLLFEKQLSISAKPKVEKKTVQHQTRRTKTKPTVVDQESRAKDSFIKKLEKDLERKKTELLRTRDELKHTQEHLLEIPTLKSELHKSKQEMKGLNKIMFSCREENTKLNKEIEKCNNSLTDKDKTLKEHKESSSKILDELKVQLNQRTSEVSNFKKELEKGHKDLWCMRSKLEQRASEVKKLQEQIRGQEKELETYNSYCLTLERIAEKLEGDISVVELKKVSVISNQNSLMLQLKDLSEKCSNIEDKLEKQTQTLQQLNVQLQESRTNEGVLKSENQELAGSLSSLQSELDIGRLEIMRQQGVIMTRENELGQTKIQLCRYQEHLELIEAQEKEVNEFVEEERRTLVNTAKDLETQLLSTKDELCLMNMSFKEKSLKYEEFAEEVKQSKDQLQEKQEELNATQTQAHWMLLQQQMEMTQAAEALKEAWDVVDGMLETFSREAGIHLEQKSTEDLEEHSDGEDENSEFQSPSQLLSSLSLVQRVLEAATANRENQSAVGSVVEDAQAASSPVEDAHTAGLPVQSRARRELNYDQEQSESVATKENDPQSLAEQVYELRQALERLAEIGSGKTADAHAQVTIRRLEEEKNFDELKFKNSLKDIELKLDASRINEVQLRREVEQHCLQISQLTASLEESRQNLQLAMAKIDSLSLQCTEQIEQETKVKMLSMDSKRMLEEIAKMESEKQSLSGELKEAFDKLDQLTREENVTDVEKMAGKLLDEKFTLERRLKQVKEKSLNYRLEMQDYVAEYRTRAENKIRILERNLDKAESEICRLDDLVESVRLALHQHRQQITGIPDHRQQITGIPDHRQQITGIPDLGKLLQFIEGNDC